MTGYKISVGYNSSHSINEVWKTLKEVGTSIADDPMLIAMEAFAYDQLDHNKLAEFAQSFTTRTDLTIRFLEDNPAQDGDRDWTKCILMYASGGGHDRRIKESLRRAYIRLVLEAMHKLQMEIDISVG